MRCSVAGWRTPTDRSRWALVVMLAAVVCVAADVEEFRVKREGPFEFAREPAVTRDGDRVTISFETKAFCDVTVAIEESSSASSSPLRGEGRGEGSGTTNSDGRDPHPNPLPERERGQSPRIVRHLASGVLGPNAPEPFQKNSKRQTLVWNGKDDQGRYVDDKDKVSVRVSLGLKARYERPFLFSAHRRIGPMPSLICAQQEGVYVFEGCGVDWLRLFDHKGNYVRTIYPFPAQNLGKLVGVKEHTFPQTGRTLPLKWGFYETTLLTSGYSGLWGDYMLPRDGPGVRGRPFQRPHPGVRPGRVARQVDSLLPAERGLHRSEDRSPVGLLVDALRSVVRQRE